MKKSVEKGSRTKIRLPKKQYNKLKELAGRIGMPVAKIVSLMIIDTIEYGRDTDALDYTQNSRRTWDDSKVNVHDINIFIDQYFKNYIYSIKYGSVNEFAIDCIDYQIKKNFKHIIDCKIPYYSTSKRIHHSTDAVYSNRGKKSKKNSDKEMPDRKFKESMYSDEVKEKYKLEPPVKKYLQIKAKQYNISENTLIMYYASKEINRILSERNRQAEIYQNPNDLDFDY